MENTPVSTNNKKRIITKISTKESPIRSLQPSTFTHEATKEENENVVAQTPRQAILQSQNLAFIFRSNSDHVLRRSSTKHNFCMPFYKKLTLFSNFLVPPFLCF